MSLLPSVMLDTILVLDNSGADVSSIILKKAGYTVLLASSPEEAVKISLEFAGTIDLLLTDVMMPNMSGADLANKLLVSRPKMSVMMMTVYEGGDVLILNYGWHLVKKPFVRAVLLEKVDAVLHGADRSQGTDHFDTRKEAEEAVSPATAGPTV